MEPPSLKIVEPPPPWLDEAKIKAKLATGVKLTFHELRPLAHPRITDYKLRKWIKEAGAPDIILEQPTRSRQRLIEAGLIERKPPDNIWLARKAEWIGGGFGVVGFVLNCVYAAQFGDVWWQSAVNATTGGLIDLVAMFGLAWAFELSWRQRWLAIVIWLLAIVYSFLAGVGFFSTMLGDHTRKGELADQYRADLTAQLSRAETDLGKLRDPKDIDKDIQAEINKLWATPEWTRSEGCSKSTRSDYACITLKQLRLERENESTRAPLRAEIDRLTSERFKLGHATGTDTVAESVGTITAGQAKPQYVVTFRTIVPAMMLTFSGLLLAFSRELRRS